jgi:hypothetical protein
MMPFEKMLEGIGKMANSIMTGTKNHIPTSVVIYSSENFTMV